MNQAPREWRGWAVVLGLLVGGVAGASRALDRLPAPHRVKDIFLPTRSSSPTGFVTVGSTVFFSAGDDLHGRELWKSDGTREGTVLVKDLCPGVSGCDPRQLTRVGHRLFFVTGGESSPYLLWTSDGTGAGTVLLKAFPATGIEYALVELTDVEGTLFFGLGRASYTVELWKSDGTREGTVRVRDLRADGVSTPHALSHMKGLLLFRTRTPAGVALWRSDGTQAGTSRLREFIPRSRGSSWTNLMGPPEVIGNRLMFPVNAPEGAQLWRSDGTVGGTAPVGPAFSWMTWLQDGNRPVRVGHTLFFMVSQTYGRGLWRSDGTDAGTRLVKDLLPQAPDTYPAWLMGGANTLYIQVYDASRRAYPLWKSDGTETGTVHLQDLAFNLRYDLEEAPRTTVGDAVYVVRTPMSNASHEQLWRIEGTAGAELIQEFRHPEPSRQVVLGTELKGRLVFAANEGLHGGEPWLSDGTKPGTRLVTDLQVHTGNASPSELTRVKDSLFFSASEGEASRRLWTSDGSAEGTRRIELALPEEAHSPTSLLEVGDTLYFLARDEQGRAQLWKSDGTRTGSVRLSQLAEGAAGSLVHLNGRLYFWSYDRPLERWALWSSDGTEAGLSLVRRTWVCNPREQPPELFVWRNALYFGGEQSVGYDLWRSDGSEAGTGPIQHFHILDRTGEPRGFIDLGDSLLFRSGEDVGAWWKSDGTTAGTMRLRDAAGAFVVEVGGTVRMGGAAFFTAHSGGRWALWKNPGHDLAPELIAEAVGAGELVNVEGTLFFLGEDERHGAELWRSDGTAAGTRLFKDLRPGPEGSDPGALTAVDGRLFLSADDGTHGREIWVSDGTEAGTSLIADLSPGEASSSPSLFTRVGDALFFKATDVAHGEELWRMSLTVAEEPPPKPMPGEVPVPSLPPPPSLPSPVNDATETPALEAAPAPEPDTKLEGLGCGVTSGAQSAGWSGLLLLGWLRARRRRRTP